VPLEKRRWNTPTFVSTFERLERHPRIADARDASKVRLDELRYAGEPSGRLTQPRSRLQPTWETMTDGATMTNGAQTLIRTLVGAGVRTCFTNPGTSEIHFVAALDSVPEMRAVLTLFEGVASGAADGYARMAGTPAATLLHLGPGLGYGLANLHNARRAKVPVVSIVGDHATYHAQYDPPLQSDIETIARNVSAWVRTPRSAEELARDAVEAIAAAIGPPGQVATLIVPADVSWQEGAEPAAPSRPAAPPAAPPESVDAAAKAIRGSRRTGILLGGAALRGNGLLAAACVASATGAKLFAERSTPRLERGAGLPAVERLAYWPELAAKQLDGLECLILVDAKPPVSWFAYPGEKSSLVSGGCQVLELSAPTSDVLRSLEALVEALDAGDARPALQAGFVPPRPDGPLTAEKVCRAVGAILPEGAIISDEAITSAAALPASTAGAPRHDWLTLTGGAIGQGLPVAVGAAIACPDRPVIALEADGSALYTIQSLWTMAREQLDVTVVIFNNRGYGILEAELGRLDAQDAGDKARALLTLGDPALDFVQLGTGFSVASRRVDTAEQLNDALEEALGDPGPHLIEAVLPAVSKS
jgi:acetolactate synthase I/II/III large subunit